jgi:hypothetical protein
MAMLGRFRRRIAAAALSRWVIMTAVCFCFLSTLTEMLEFDWVVRAARSGAHGHAGTLQMANCSCCAVKVSLTLLHALLGAAYCCN